MKVILIITAIIIGLRLLLPYVILYFINKRLSGIKGYRGSVSKIRLQLYKGILKVNDITLNKQDDAGKTEHPFFKASGIEFCVQWIALFHKSIIGDLIIENPELEIQKDKKDESKASEGFSIKKAFQKVIPFTINIEIRNGQIHYVDNFSKAKTDLLITNLLLKARSVSNIADPLNPLPATIQVSAGIYEGTISANMNWNPLTVLPTFDLNTEIKDINLVLLNSFLRAYARIDVNKGTFGMYTEVAAKEGEFKGYIKPVFEELDLIGAEDRDDKLFQKLWESFVAIGIQILKNKRTDQVATKISIEGNLSNPHINILSAIITILRNGFVQALKPSIDDVINVESVKETVTQSKKFIKRIFGSHEDSKVKAVS